MTRKQLLITIAGLALCAIPATATAHGGNNDPNVVHACIGNVSKVVRIVGVSDVCLASPHFVAETPAHWSIQGPQGPQGAQGPQGPQGTAGTNGIDGTNGTNGIDGASVTFGGYFTGNQNGCPNGGVIFIAGNPVVNAYVCNGTNGINGTDGQQGSNGVHPDGACFDNTNRYVNCGNGTVTDTATGLVWLQDASCLGSADWATGNTAAAALADGQCGLTDGSSAGDWRLPTDEEWKAMVTTNACMNELGPSLANDAATACLLTGPSSFVGVPTGYATFLSGGGRYWSSTSVRGSHSKAFYINLQYGNSSSAPLDLKSNVFRLWPVRGGSR